MPFHFNTPGDFAYNEKRYADALELYKASWVTLKQTTEPSHFKHASAYILNRVVVTTVMLLCSDGYRENSEHLYREFDCVNTELNGMGGIETTEEIRDVLKQLSIQCEQNSNSLWQQHVENIPLEEVDLSHITNALTWLSRAIVNFKSANETPPITIYFSYLYVLECIYKKTKSEEDLAVLETYIKHLFTNKPERMEKVLADKYLELELLSHQLLVAIERKSPEILNLSTRASILMKWTPMDPKCVLAHSLTSLIAVANSIAEAANSRTSLPEETNQRLPPLQRLKRGRAISDSDSKEASAAVKRQRTTSPVTFFDQSSTKMDLESAEQSKTTPATMHLGL